MYYTYIKFTLQRDKMRKNYFEVGKPVSDDKFIGREDELKQIDFFVKNGQSLVLIAPRRYGKTSLAKKFLNSIDNTYIKIEIDFMRYLSKKDLADAIIDKCYENLKYKKAIKDMKSGLLSFSKKLSSIVKIDISLLQLDGFEKFFSTKDINEDEYLLYAFEFCEILSAACNKKAIIFIDEFGEISKFDKDNNLLKQLRSIIQLQKNTTYIFAGSQASLMKNIFLNKDEPFFKFAIILQVEKLKKDSFLKYCEKTLKKDDLIIEDKLLEVIYDYCGGVAYNLSLFMTMLLLSANKQIDISDIEATKTQVLQMSSYAYENEIASLKKKKHYLDVILYISNNKSPYKISTVKKQNINIILKILESDGFITKIEERYILNDVLFRAYLLKNIKF